MPAAPATGVVTKEQQEAHAIRLNFEVETRVAAEQIFQRAFNAGHWRGDVQRSASSVARYALSILERGFVQKG